MISIYFGSPGSGKTTLACREILKAQKAYRYTFANFGCKCADFDDVSLSQLGEWTFPEDSYIAIDEAGIEYNNRKFKSLSQDTIKWFKLHRHYCCDVSIWSQSWEDMDVTIRRLADRLYYIKRFGPFSLIRRVYKRVTVDDKTEQIIDGYKMVSLLYLLLKPLYYASFLCFGLGFVLKVIFPKFADVKLVLRRPYYKYFDTHAAPDLPMPFDLSLARRNNTSFSRGKFVVRTKHFTSIIRPDSVILNRKKGICRKCGNLVRGIIQKAVKTAKRK